MDGTANTYSTERLLYVYDGRTYTELGWNDSYKGRLIGTYTGRM